MIISGICRNLLSFKESGRSKALKKNAPVVNFFLLSAKKENQSVPSS